VLFRSPGAGLSNFNNLGLSSQTIGPGVNSATNAMGAINPMGAAPTSTQIAESTLAPSSLAPSDTYGNMRKGFGQLFDDGGFEAFKQAGGEGGIPLETGEAAMKLGSPVAGAALSLFEPPMPEPYVDPDTGKYRGPQGQLNLGDQFDTGLRLATGGTVQSGGIRDLYGTPDNQPTISPGLSGFGLGRLNNLAGEQAMTQAQTLGYADGGEVGMNLDDNTLNLNLAGKRSDSESRMNSFVPNYRMNSFVPNYRMNSFVPNYSMGAYDPFRPFLALPSNSSMPKASSYALNVNTGKQEAQGDGTNFLRALLAREDENSLSGRIFGGLLDNINNLPNPFAAMSGAGRSATPSYSLNVNTGKQEAQGKAQGGYLDGQGDGMSDSIPATIEGKQPARLADGEFVVPADVVSHLGNGSSKAGSKRLYAMLDKVRHARTGNKKQGKEIKADKYLPA
jgi:hypothetical protein